MYELALLLLLFAVVIIAAYFYLKRRQQQTPQDARTSTDVPDTSRHDDTSTRPG